MNKIPFKINKLTSALLFSSLIFISNPSNADYNLESVSGSAVNDTVFYQIGGGAGYMSPPSLHDLNVLELGIGWEADLMCGNFSLEKTIKNTFNTDRIKDSAKSLLGNLIGSVKGAIASMPAMILQRANPQLYDLITNGMYQAKIDFNRLKTNCEQMSSVLADTTFNGKWSKYANLSTYKDIMTNSTDLEINGVKQEYENKKGLDGGPWIGGVKKGGQSQSPMNIIGDVAKAGYNILNQRNATDTSTVSKSSCKGALCETFDTPKKVADYLTDVVGEISTGTCSPSQGCPETKTKPGQGLTTKIEKTNIQVVKDLQNTLNEGTPTTESLAKLSTATVPVTRGLIEALKNDPDVDVLSQKLAVEIATAKEMERLLLARRAILAGMREPNVIQNENAQAELEKTLKRVDLEIEQVNLERNLQKDITQNTAKVILQNQRSRQAAANSLTASKDSVDKRISDLQYGKSSASSDGRATSLGLSAKSITLSTPSVSNIASLGTGGSSGSGSTGSSTSGISSNLQKYITGNAYAEGRSTIYKNADGTYSKRVGGSLAWRNNNPGNIRMGEFAKANGAIGVGPDGFAIFPDRETGAKAITRLLKTKDYNNLTVAEAIHRYAPSVENDTAAYIKSVSGTTGLTSDTKMDSLSDAQLSDVVNAIQKVEGWKEGSISKVN
ncbi:integrating conjugative element protein [Phocoenobacter skyensis]|uniref:integrating conjugative element protein n=1 Tax=Phocoenobacter skyensis TaxID=97481 RepID=UPI00276FD04E|nr:integrating conjugative element protein [Pasteurella skyensis]MDP8185343.1 integrating conjugative element protein [Pasteurella skyensis]